MKSRTGYRHKKHERGISLLETVIAAAVMLIGIGGVMSLFTVGAMKNASQGTQATRCTEYAQDKMEQLMALSFSDLNSDTTQVPTATGTTATGTGLFPGGSTYPSAAVTGYVDYVTEATVNGLPTSPAIYTTQQSTSSYMRQWSVVASTTNPTNVKMITVTVVALQKIDQAVAPSTTLVSYKTSIF